MKSWRRWEFGSAIRHSRSAPYPVASVSPSRAQARARGLGVIFITHNPHHAYPIGDHFTLLNRGRSYGTFAKSEISREELVAMMAGGEELEELSHELAEFARTDAVAGAQLAQAAQELEVEAGELHIEELPGSEQQPVSDQQKEAKQSQ